MTLTEMLDAATPESPLMVAVDPLTGCVVRAATEAEAVAYETQPCRHPSFRKAIRVGEVLVDTWHGYGRIDQGGWEWL